MSSRLISGRFTVARSPRSNFCSPGAECTGSAEVDEARVKRKTALIAKAKTFVLLIPIPKRSNSFPHERGLRESVLKQFTSCGRLNRKCWDFVTALQHSCFHACDPG